MNKQHTSSRKYLIWLLLACIISGLFGSAQTNPEAFRPQFHFSPKTGWMNDPNGLVYDNGEYHLFYQHNPNDTKWGPMHWGHAVSSDLIHWQNLPIALEPDKLGMIFSGSAVIDTDNTAGFGQGTMVAVFTHDLNGAESQSLAYSTDHGRTWTKYALNPVLEPLNNLRNFRDPKVFWYTPGYGAGHWVMLIAAGSSVLIYESGDLKNWKISSNFGLGYGATCGVWETPDLLELPITGGSQKRWVLTVGVNNCAPAGGTGVQYFVGQFDGKSFNNENPKNQILWADYGADFYAAQAWNNAPDGRHIWAAWMNNWQYAQDLPSVAWRGALSFPRELALKRTAKGYRLTQQPIRELERLRQHKLSLENLQISDTQQPFQNLKADTLEVIANFKLEKTQAAERFGLRVRTGQNEQTTVGYNLKTAQLFVDRSHSGKTSFNPNFPKIHLVHLEPINNEIRLHLLIDRASLEIFSEDGLLSLTENIFPDGSSMGLEVFAQGGKVLLSKLEVYELQSALEGSR